jgi:MFS family permease
MFFLVGAIAGPVFGRWSDFIGRSAALLLVLGIMGAGTILCFTAPTLELLVTGRRWLSPSKPTNCQFRRDHARARIEVQSVAIGAEAAMIQAMLIQHEWHLEHADDELCICVVVSQG